MRERAWGRVIAILSWGVREPIPGIVLSNTGRSALAAWLKTASRAIGGDGVTFNGVLPGTVRDAADRASSTKAGPPARAGSVEHVRARPWRTCRPGRDGDPDELGALVAYLASEPAAYVNGAFIPIDGGLLRSLG